MRNLWLIFAQSATVGLGLLLVATLFKPDLLSLRETVVAVSEAPAVTERRVAPVVSFHNAAARAMPAVVNISTSKEVSVQRHPFVSDPMFQHFFGGRVNPETQRIASLGSGVIVSPDGYIVTNQHVVEAADEIQVALADGRSLTARLVGSDPDTDLAVLKVELGKLPAITLGRVENAQVGDVVLAIGNPFGVGQTVTMGIVSALGRNHLGINTFENFIQTDAAINPGNSGGALIDTYGHLIGINSAIYSRSGGSLGIGFAIPVDVVKQVMQQIIEHGGVVRGWIGVEVQDITPELAESLKLKASAGALIAGVLRGGPADQAGIQPGDVLIAVNSRQVADSASMLDLVSKLAPNSTAELTVVRNRNQLSIATTVGRRPAKGLALAD